MAYWIEDYDSPGEPLEPDYYDKIIDRCKDALKKRNKVRVGYVILEDLKLEASKSDLIEVVCALESTGKYQSRAVKRRGSSDFIISKVPKKSLVERYWLIADIIKLAAGAAIGYGASRLLHI